ALVEAYRKAETTPLTEELGARARPRPVRSSSLKGRTAVRHIAITPMRTPIPTHGNTEKRPNVTDAGRVCVRGAPILVGLRIQDLDRGAEWRMSSRSARPTCTRWVARSWPRPPP